MKKRILSLALVGAMCVALLASCGGKKNATWKVTCPWAPSGVAAMVSQQAATKSTEYSDTITLVAEAIKGDAATVNTWVADTKANDTELVFVGEGLLSITSILDPAKMQFGYEDFVFVENLYSSIFVLSADAKLNISSVADLEAYVQQGTEISVAVNGATGSEAFLAASLFGAMGAGDKLKLTPAPAGGVQSTLTPKQTKEAPAPAPTASQQATPPPVQPLPRSKTDSKAGIYTVIAARLENRPNSTTHLLLDKPGAGQIHAFAIGNHPELTAGTQLTGCKLELQKQDTVVFYILRDYRIVVSQDQAA